MAEERNISAIEKELDNLKKLRSNHQYRDFWNLVKEMPSIFKELRLPREVRERLWSEYNDICASAKQELKAYNEKIQSNAFELDRELKSLEYDHLYEKPTDDSMLELLLNPISTLFPARRFHYREFWLHTKEITNLFKSLKLARNDRERLWSRYSNLCDHVKRCQRGEQNESEKNRGILQSLIQDASNQAEAASNRGDILKARDMQTKNLELMEKSEFIGKDRGAVWEYWKKTNDKIHSKREDIQKSNFLNARIKVGRICNTAESGDPYETLEKIKEMHKTLSGIYMDYERKKELFSDLSNAWDKASGKIGEIKKEKTRKYEQWRERMEENVERWERNKEKTEDFISRMENQIYKLEDEESNARTPEYAARVRGWIEEKETKIRSGRDQLLQLEEKLYSVRKKLSG